MFNGAMLSGYLKRASVWEAIQIAATLGLFLVAAWPLIGGWFRRRKQRDNLCLQIDFELSSFLAENAKHQVTGLGTLRNPAGFYLASQQRLLEKLERLFPLTELLGRKTQSLFARYLIHLRERFVPAQQMTFGMFCPTGHQEFLKETKDMVANLRRTSRLMPRGSPPSGTA